ncbi:autotransporter assembly complex family protein [Tropicimonas sp. IMCC34043]|uniref:autotransporter assembly complex protein TamA n=1 Tax=Tropicimonas sp. IMCC34043 TaxID=2248760 RepID=UPI000E26212C|nr:autotransporter assembly complex family protein [Tropicimonas sp. IMCC34043]
MAHPLLRAGVTALFAAATFPAAALDSIVVLAPGADAGLTRSLEGASLLKRAKQEERTDPAELLATARAEYRRMISVLYGAGYYSGTISVRIDGREAADIPPLNPPARIRQIEVIVTPGPQFTFSQATVKPLAPGTELPDGYAVGQIARSGAIGQAAKSAASAWRDVGHAKVDLVNEDIAANHATNKLASNLTLDPGPRLRFGPLVVQGNKRVRTDRIKAIAGLPTGEVYNPQDVTDAAERLRRSGAFRSVALREADTIGPGDELAINADLVEERRRRLGFGVEFTSQEGTSFNAYWMHRNLLGGAENLRFDLTIDNIGTTEPDNGTDYYLTGVFTRPATFTPDTDLFFNAGISHQHDPGYTSDSIQFGTGLNWRISKRLTASGGIGFRASDVDDAFGSRTYKLINFPLNLTWDTRDNEFDPTKGVYLSTGLIPFVGISDMPNGAQTLIDARSYLGFGERRNTVLAGRVQLGSLYGPSIPEAPEDYLFFAGGGGSVRGQPYQSLGAGTFNGQIFGGRSYVALSGEVRSYVRGNIGLVGFYDMGYVGAEEFYNGSGNWMSGAGIGVRYKTGFGPIRADIATPVSGGPSDADSVQLYIGIGQAF